jgi:Fic family protein
MNETNFSLRQQKILELLQHNPDGLNRLELESQLAEASIELSKVTLLRDLNELLESKQIVVEGVGKSTKYLFSAHSLVSYIDMKQYFSKDIDERSIKNQFNADVFKEFAGIFTDQELRSLSTLNENYQKNIQSLPQDIYKKELERFVIELSWKSSKIEGNTYSLLETEALIREAKKAEGKTDDEAQMILNHKQAFDIIIEHSSDFKKLTVNNIFDIHQALIAKMNISAGVRKNQVGITGTKYRPLANQWQLEDGLNELIRAISNLEYPFEKAFLAVSGISYLQAFSDGNKRTGRLLANAILMAHNWAPLSYRNVDEIEYKQAMLLFYEQNNLFHLKRIFIEQFEFVVENYFQG